MFCFGFGFLFIFFGGGEGQGDTPVQALTCGLGAVWGRGAGVEAQPGKCTAPDLRHMARQLPAAQRTADSGHACQ